jgi:hypothetical protein
LGADGALLPLRSAICLMASFVCRSKLTVVVHGRYAAATVGETTAALGHPGAYGAMTRKAWPSVVH